jgi:phospholipid-translocating P-type ATPase (flippase)
VISHVFSDKTGTLTENVMVFRKCSIGGVSFGRGSTDIATSRMKRMGLSVPLSVMGGVPPLKRMGPGGDPFPFVEPVHAPQTQKSVNFDGPELLHALELEASSENTGGQPCHEFFLHLALCHSILVDDRNEWSAQSPDELALVGAADYFGFKFVGQHRGVVTISMQDGSERKFQRMDELEFTSERKRMSVIVRDLATGKIEVLVKGADNTVWPRLTSAAGLGGVDGLKKRTMQQLSQYGSDGLRTLAIASKSVGEAEYAAWKEEYQRATTDLAEIERKKEGQPNRINDLMDAIESGLVLLGATAIEDKLQAGVSQCIKDLAVAGIATWVLTGDKEETAINIAHACLLLDDSMCVLVLNLQKCATVDEIRHLLVGRARQIEELADAADAASAQKFGLVIDGDTLQLVMDAGTGCRPALLRYVQHCVAVVACRCAPFQKAEIVQLIRDNIAGCRTLSIGDGANDVPMIQAAHVGVGISGHEGLQAVNNSDFAIAQFRFLKELLLTQGRNNYRRMSTLVLYLFYKNVMMVLTQYWFTISCTGVSGQKFSPDFGTQAFNAVWTFWPILLLGVFDRDVGDDYALAYPQMYHCGIRNHYFRPAMYTQWLLDAVAESLCITFMTVAALRQCADGGQDAGLWLHGAHTFSLVVTIVNFKLLFHQHRWHWAQVAIWALGIAIWWPCCYIGSMYSVFASGNWSTYSQGWYGLWSKVQELPVFWLLLLLVPVIIFAPQALRILWRRERFPEFVDKVIEVERFKLSDTEDGLSAYAVPARAGDMVYLPGSDDAPNDIAAHIGPLPLPGVRKAGPHNPTQGTGTAPGLPGFPGGGLAARTSQRRSVV